MHMQWGMICRPRRRGAGVRPGEKPGAHGLHQRGVCIRAGAGVPGRVEHGEPGGDQPRVILEVGAMA